MGHYQNECNEPKKADEKAKDNKKAPGTSASAVEPDAECEGAWAAELVEDAIKEGPGSICRFPIWIGSRRRFPRWML
jgi:hypothetical protein